MARMTSVGGVETGAGELSESAHREASGRVRGRDSSAMKISPVNVRTEKKIENLARGWKARAYVARKVRDLILYKVSLAAESQ